MVVEITFAYMCALDSPKYTKNSIKMIINLNQAKTNT